MSQASTGKKINRGSDNPAGLDRRHQHEHELDGRKRRHRQRAAGRFHAQRRRRRTAQIGSLLDEVENLAAASTSDAGLSAAQLRQPGADRPGHHQHRPHYRHDEFQRQETARRLDGHPHPGVDSTKVNDIRVYTRNSASTSTDVSVALTTAATKATEAGYATTSAAAATKISIDGQSRHGHR